MTHFKVALSRNIKTQKYAQKLNAPDVVSSLESDEINSQQSLIIIKHEIIMKFAVCKYALHNGRGF